MNTVRRLTTHTYIKEQKGRQTDTLVLVIHCLSLSLSLSRSFCKFIMLNPYSTSGAGLPLSSSGGSVPFVETCNLILVICYSLVPSSNERPLICPFSFSLSPADLEGWHGFLSLLIVVPLLFWKDTTFCLTPMCESERESEKKRE